MSQGNGKDKALARAETVRSILRLPAKKKLDALTEAPNSKEIIRAMPAADLYYALQEVGLADYPEIVQLASPAQFRTFIDLGAWTRDRIDPHQVLTWLRAARGDDEADLYAKVDALDVEVLEFMLRAFTTVHDLEANPDVNPEGVTLETPEGKYLIELHVEGVELAALRQLIQDLIARNPLETVRFLEATRWEVPTELEETAYRFRSARLEDLGFPPLEEAMALFAFRDPDKVGWTPPPAPATNETALSTPSQRVDYLDAALRDLSPQERENFDQELRALANAALVAEIQDPGDLDAVRRVGEMTRDYLSLGLEHLTRGAPQLAMECVRDLEARKIFQVGFSLTLKLKFRVDRIAREPLSRIGDVWLALREEADALTALRRKRPLRALKVEGAEPVPFRSRRELEESSRIIDRAIAQIALMRALLGGTGERAQAALATFGKPLEELGVEAVLAAAIAHAAADGTPKVAPVPVPDLGRALAALFRGTPDNPTVDPDTRERVMELFTALVPEAQRADAAAAVNRVLERLREEVAPGWLRDGRVDPAVAALVPTVGTKAP
ncbi:MAG: hypothetical protein IRZ16_13200 [Myxococcaceae bacterium]|nr:hypothetical protein [Myxococcaceae bacterium]